MSLLVHLPLNGNLENKGLDNVTVTQNGSSTSYVDGKIGQCLSCNGSTYWIVSGITLGEKASICCWTKTSTNGRMSWVLNANVYALLNLYENSIYTLNRGDSNNNPFVDDSGSNISVLHDGLWHHSVVTFDGTNAKLYIDGIYRGKAKTYRSPATPTNSRIKLGGGFNNAHTWNWNGGLNDFRVYDHCLSPKEVKEISKGLICHYPLNDWYNTSLTNKYNGDNFYGSALALNKFIKSKLENEDGYNYKFQYTGNGSSIWAVIRFPSFTFTAETIHQYSLYARCNVAQNTGLLFRSARISNDYMGCRAVNVATLADGEWHRYELNQLIPASFTYNGTTYNSNPLIELFSANLNVEGTEYVLDIDLKFVQVIESSIKVPVINNNFKSTIVYDTSGYNNNGTVIGTLSLSNDTPRYDCSTGFGIGNKINPLLYPSFLTNEATVSMWVKLDQLPPSNPGRTMLYTAWYGFSCEITSKGNTYFRTWLTSGKQDSPSEIITTGNWIHWVGVKSPTGVSLYLNGTLIGTTSNSNNFDWSLLVSNAIGCYNESNYLYGKLSDLRLYATALSADDIKELYNTSAFITDNGTTECYEFDEVDDELSINKNGIIKIGNLYESSAEYTEDVYFTGTGGTYKPSANANNQCKTFYIVYSNVLSKDFIVEFDFTWTGPWAAGTGGTYKPVYWNGTAISEGGSNNLGTTSLNTIVNIRNLVENSPDGGSYHVKYKFNTGNTANAWQLRTRTNYSDGVGSFSITNLKIYPAEQDLDTEQTKIGDDYITSNNFIEI